MAMIKQMGNGIAVGASVEGDGGACVAGGVERKVMGKAINHNLSWIPRPPISLYILK